jgi:hypothetical protein
MATMDPTLEISGSPTNGQPVVSSHQYHGEAHALSGHLHHPVYQAINEQARVALKDYRGGHVVEQTRGFTLEGVISFLSGRSRVSGSRSLKTNGWITLSTSIVEGLNVLEVITADRMVSQVSTEHAYTNGHVPDVTFLGTQFVNLRLSGFLLEPTFNFGICGKRPPGKTPYVKDVQFLNGVKSQVDKVAKSDLPKDIRDKYSERLQVIDGLIAKAGEPGWGDVDGNGKDEEPIVVTCSLVESIDVSHIPIPGLKTQGNVLFIPEFGSVALGEIEVSSSYTQGNCFTVKMIDMKLGCVGDGSVTAGTAAANGHHHP